MLIHITADNDDTVPLPVTFAAGDQVELDADAVINSLHNAIVGLSEEGGATITLLGSVQAGESGIDAVSGDNMITIGSTGSISATLDGMWLGSFGDATGRNIVQNHGSITTSSVAACGILSFTSDNQVTNTGTITSSIGISLGGTSNNVPLGSHNKVTNGGIINATLCAVALAGDASSLNNSGMIKSGSAVELHGTAQGIISVINTGTIQSTDGTAITGQNEADWIDNSGTIIGSILLNGGNDRYDGESGSVTGSIVLGAGNDVGIGSAGSEVFDSGDGDDTLNGGLGNDTLDGGLGLDVLRFTGSKGAAVNLALKSAQNTGYGKDLVLGIEALWGGAGADRFTGNSANNEFIGGAGRDTISGGGGHDTLAGGVGSDRLSGGSGKDLFVFDTKLSSSANVDMITDFKRVDDTFRLENAIFKKLVKAGTLSKSSFAVGSKAKDKNDYIVYDKAKGALYYDADGSGKGAAVKFAQITKGTSLGYNDFLII